MAISTSNYFSNAIVGVPQVAGEYVDIFATSPNAKYALGTKYERQDGAVFRYSQFGVASNPGDLVSSNPLEVTKGYAVAQSCVAPASTYQEPTEPVGVYPGGIGSRFLNVVTLGAGTTANQFAGAYISLIGVASVGGGQTYRIKSHGASSSTSVANVYKLSLYDQIQTNVAATTSYAIAPSRYVNVSVTTNSVALASGVVVGAQSANQFGWIQTQGIIAVKGDATIGSSNNVGVPVTVSNISTGAVGVQFILGNTGVATVGTCMAVGTIAAVGSSSQHVLVSLNIE